MKTAITSMTLDYYENKGGEKCVETFLQGWPGSIKLVIYWEGDLNLSRGRNRPDGVKLPDRVSFVHMDEAEYLQDFLKNISKFPIMSGHYGDKYTIELDARMCRAGFIHAHAMKTIGGKVFWIDADMVTHSPMPESFLDEVLPDDKLCCCLERPWFNTETGFLGMNADHPLAMKWVKVWQMVYTSGLIFTQDGWHDNWGFDLARRLFGHPEAFLNLAAGLPAKTMHPLINSKLGAYFDHLKGNRKNGKSSKEDLTVVRTEPYWTT